MRSGRAEKGQVQRMVGSLLSLAEPPEPDHAADALAVAICHANGAPLAGRLQTATSGGAPALRGTCGKASAWLRRITSHDRFGQG